MSRPYRPGWAAALTALALSAGCTSYEPAPLDPQQLLRELERAGLSAVAAAPTSAAVGSYDPRDGLSVREAAATAVALNPALLALRAEVAVADAQLVEAGLLPDVTIGWEAGNNVADFITEGKSSANSYIAGASVEWPLPRPGELDAKEGIARAGIAGAQARVLAAEWALVREVHEAYVTLLVARARVEQTGQLAALAGRSLEYLERARGLGAATAIDENLARIGAGAARADALRAEAAQARAAQDLNALLGLPPALDWVPETGLAELLGEDPGELDPAALVADALLSEALARRPDLREAQADYQRAEERLRLEVARQWPQVAIGTGISITLPLFSRFNQPAVRTAGRERAAAGLRLRSAVARVRQEVHAALLERRQAARLLRLYRDQLAPALADSLRLTEQAFAAREVTPLEILTAQQQVIEARARALEAQERQALARVRLDAARGALLPDLHTRFPAHEQGGAE